MKPCKIPQNKTTCGIFKEGGFLDNCKKGGAQGDRLIRLIQYPPLPITQLIINELHLMYGHAGRLFVKAKLREKYWVISVNHLVRKCLNDCLVCKKRFKESGKQLMANLPADRLEADMPPFTSKESII